MRRRLVVLAATSAFLLVVFFVANVETWLGDTPLVLAAPQSFVVQKGGSLTTVANRLEELGLLASSHQLLWLARFKGGGNRILAGEYELAPGQTLSQLLAALNDGTTVREQITIIEGGTFAQLMKQIHSTPGINLTTVGLDTAEVMNRLGLAGQVAEGNFFPDTYFFGSGITDLELLKQMHRTMQTHLDNAWQHRGENLAITSPQAALILASIIEKESGTQSERARISGVFHRRLQIGMRLQADSTIIYGLGDEFDGDLRRGDMRRDTPFNSYLHHGLPPTAIALPGLASIEAAVHPDMDDNSLYFVARGDGSHQFSASLAEHNRAVRRYQLGIR